MTALDALNLAVPLADTYSAVEQRLLVAIARQLTLNDNHALNEVSKWQIKQLANMGMLRKDAARIIAAGTKGVPADFADTVQQAIAETLAEDRLVDMWENEGFSESAKQAIKHYRRQAQDVYNQVNTVMKYKAESTLVRAAFPTGCSASPRSITTTRRTRSFTARSAANASWNARFVSPRQKPICWKPQATLRAQRRFGRRCPSRTGSFARTACRTG